MQNQHRIRDSAMHMITWQETWLQAASVLSIRRGESFSTALQSSIRNRGYTGYKVLTMHSTLILAILRIP